jgi:hypothetical protein
MLHRTLSCPPQRCGEQRPSRPPIFLPAQLQGHETLFIMTPCQGMASPRHQQSRCTITKKTMTVQKHKLRGKLGIWSILGHSLFIFRTSEHCNSTPLHAIKGEGGTLNREAQQDNTTLWQCSKHTHSSNRTHPHRETWEPSLSRPAYIPLLQALRCKATRAATSTGCRNI